MRLSLLAGALLAGSACALPAATNLVPTSAPPRSFSLVKRADNSTSSYPPPSQDPFYQPPSGFASQSNGAVLKSRNVSTEFDQLSKAYQLLYRTTDAQGKADATVTTVFVPLKPLSPPRVMLYLTPADTAAEDCQTSWSFVSPASNATSSSAELEVLIALQKGWYVTVPDHEGSKAAFISGVTEAKAGLDGLRALNNFRTAFADKRGWKAVIRGYSGGGHAAAWATTYLRQYGAGLPVVGASFGGVPVDIYYTMDLLSGSANNYLAFSAIAGLANAEPTLNAWLQRNLTPNGTAAVAFARNNSQCYDSGVTPYPYKNADIYGFFRSGEASLHQGIPAQVVSRNKLGTAQSGEVTGTLPSSVPVFMFHGKTDETVSYGPIKPYYLDQCSRGAHIHLSTTSGTSHTETFLYYLADSYVF
ncbi:hypothetical protein JCM8097_007757, partial [Rhodosporidiobolus ruineniae]